jgi:ATP-dependent Lhr-like helicase
VVGPEKPELEIFELFKQRLLNTKVRLVCVNCGDWEQSYIVKELPKDVKCRKCGARLIAPLNYRTIGATKLIKKILRKVDASTDERKKYEKLKQTADLFLVYRDKAVKALVGRGVGPQTAKRILAKYHKDEDALFRDVLEAERNFIKTKKYWRI